MRNAPVSPGQTLTNLRSLDLRFFKFQLGWFPVFTQSRKWQGMWFLQAWDIAP